MPPVISLRKFLPLIFAKPCRQIRLKAVAVLVLPFAFMTTAGAQSSPTLSWDTNPESDIAGYVVHLGLASGDYPIVQDVGNLTSYGLSGLLSGTTYYCAIQAYNSDGLSSELSSEISFTLPAAAGNFEAWASAGGLSGLAASPAAMPFQDGVRNILKYAFNMNPSGPDTRTLEKGSGTAGLPVFTLDQNGAQSVFTVEFLRRKGSGLVYTPKISTDLGSFAPMTETPLVSNVDVAWERVKVQKPVNIAFSPRLFGIVEVTMP